MGHILGDKTNFNKYKKIKNIEGMFSDDSRIQLNISNRMIPGKFSNIWIINSPFLNRPQVKEEKTRGIRQYFELN